MPRSFVWHYLSDLFGPFYWGPLSGMNRAPHITLWLGHEQTSTTEVYLHADTEIKKDALDRTKPPHVIPGTYTPPADILTWLEAL